jgi:hypothetical protein
MEWGVTLWWGVTVLWVGLISYAVLSLIVEGMDHGTMWTLLGLAIGCAAMVRPVG